MVRSDWRAIPLLAALAATMAFGAGNVVDLSYDPAGNLTQIRRQSTSGLAITGFDPAAAAVGSNVTIYGAGFSATPSSNTVKFNGVPTTVSAADSGSLSVSVPAGASTGRITVTVGAATATSAQDFQVVVPGVPVVASFSPAVASPGAVVTVTGSNFAPSASVTVKLNASPAGATIASATSLQFSVPASTASGRIAVTNPTGTGTSAQDLIVPPSGYSATDIATTLRLAMGGSASGFGVGAVSKHGLLLFDGTVDTYYTVQFGQLSHSPSTATLPYAVYKPDNTVLVTGYVGYGYRPTIHLPKLPATGTYSIYVSPGVATMNAMVSVAPDPVLSLDGPIATVAMGSPSQTTRTVFDATAGQSIGVGVSGYVQNASTTSAAYFNLVQPDGSVFGGGSVLSAYWMWPSNSAGNWDGEFTAPATGRYQLIGQPVTGFAASYGIAINSDVAGTLTADTAVDVTLARVGQDARFTFAAAPGDSRAIDLAFTSPQPVAQSIAYRVLKPDGTLFAQGSTSPPLNGSQVQLPAFPVAGNYAVVVDPAYGTYGTLRLSLKQGPLLATTDAHLAFGTSVNGETARFRFAGTVGQNLSIGISGLSYVGSSASTATLAVFKPDGTQLTYVTCNPAAVGGNCRLPLAALPAAGTYVVTLQPPAGVRATGNITLSADLTGSLTDNTPVAVAVSRTGQYARYTFAGTVGQSAAVELAQLVTSPSGPYVYVYVNKPDGTTLTSGSANANGVFVPLPSLPVAGTYTVLVDGSGVNWSGRLALKSGVSTSIGAAPSTLATSITGESMRLNFSGTSGTKVEVGLAGLAYDSASTSGTTLNVYRPDATSIASANCLTSSAGGGCEPSMPSTLPVTGTYSIVLTPPAGRRLAGGTLAISVPATATFTIGGGSQSVAITRPGQTARYTFSGTSAQLLRLSWSGVAVSIPSASAISVSVLKPDGSTLTSGSFGNGATGSLDIPSLPSTGTYTVVFDPSTAATMSATVNLVTR